MNERLGSYQLIERVGEGATSIVHRALDRFGRTVAVKEPRPELLQDPEVLDRLRREARTMARVRSPYVARAFDACVDAERPCAPLVRPPHLVREPPAAFTPYLVTEYVPGLALRDLVAAYGPLRGEALRAFAARLARGVAAIHGAGVLHRDLKPGNVMVLGGSPKIIDFGIARDAGDAPMTRPGVLAGTPGYVAPELIDGGTWSPAADVFSWAVTVAFAATGRAPFGAGSLHGVCFRVLRGAADLVGVPGPLLSLLRAAMVRDPAKRPPAVRLAAQLDASPPLAAA